MSYSQGGLIAATDYNGFVGTATQSGTINYVWSTGNGQYGYGQGALSQSASTASTVTAAQWATAINTLNSIYTHQTGSGTGLTAPTSGTLIAYLSALSGDISTINSSHLSFYAQGSTTTGSVYSPTATAASNATYGESTILQRVVTFSSGDAARYFFNAGGQINFVITSVTNNDGTSRSGDAVTVIGTNFAGVSAIRATTNGGIQGSGGTNTVNNTGVGYYSLTTSPVVYQQVTTTSGTYSGDYVKFYMSCNGTQGSNADNGSVINLYLNYYSAHTSASGSTTAVTNDTLNITVNHRVDIVYPETTNLSSSWGTVTIT